MSSIAFHAPHRTVRVAGPERHYFSDLSARIAWSVLALDARRDRAWAEQVFGDRYAFSSSNWTEALETSYRVGMLDGGVLVGGRRLDPMALSCNTLIAMGSPVLSLIGRLHGMCEDFAWVDDQDAAWLAQTVRAGRASNVLRAGMGWEDVATLADEIAAGASGPIVTSHSVSEPFPAMSLAIDGGWDPGPDPDFPEEPHYDAFYELSEAERWALCVPAMKARRHNRQLAGALQDVGFLSGASMFDLIAERASQAI